jgi:hypothetical protein
LAWRLRGEAKQSLVWRLAARPKQSARGLDRYSVRKFLRDWDRAPAVGRGVRFRLFDIVDRNCGRFCGRVFPGREAPAAGCGVVGCAMSACGGDRVVLRGSSVVRVVRGRSKRRSAELPRLGAFRAHREMAREGFGFGSSAKKGIW